MYIGHTYIVALAIAAFNVTAVVNGGRFGGTTVEIAGFWVLWVIVGVIRL